MYFTLKNVALNKGTNALEDRTIVLKQDEDITLRKYILYIYNTNYKMVYALRGKDKLPFNVEKEPYYGEERFDPITGAVYEVHDNRFFLDIDFDNPIDAVAIEYKDKTGYFEIPVKYAYADKEAYYKKTKRKRISR